MRIVIINQFNSDNIGDNLIGLSMKEFFSNQGIDVELAGYAQMTFQKVQRSKLNSKAKIVSRFKNCCPESFKYLLLYRKKIDAEINRIYGKGIDAIIIGGGQLIKHNSVFSFCFKKWAKFAKSKNIPLYIYGIGVDNDLNFFEKYLYENGMWYAKNVVCRDEASSHYLKKIYKRNIELKPDVVFSLDMPERNVEGTNLIVMPYTFNTAKKHFKSLENRDLYYEKLISLISDETYNDLILTATTSKDLDECYSFGEFLEKNFISYRIVAISSSTELIREFLGAKKIITGRMHAMIIGMICQVEIVPLEISSKIIEFKKEYINGNESIDSVRAASVDGMMMLLNDMEN